MMEDATHEVTNQPPPLENYDAYETDRALVEAVEREGGGWHASALAAMGRLAGSADHLRAGVLANENRPVLRTHDRYGHRIDEVDFHPAWHQLMSGAIR